MRAKLSSITSPEFHLDKSGRSSMGCAPWSIKKFPDICIFDGYPMYLTAFGKPRDTFREIVHKSSVAKSTSKASKGMIGGIPVCCRSLLEIAFVIY